MRFLVLLIACAVCVQACDTSSSEGSPATSGGVAGMAPATQPMAGTPAPNLNAGAGGAAGSPIDPGPTAGTGAAGTVGGAGAGAAGTGGTGGAGGAGAAGAGAGGAAGASETPDAGAPDAGSDPGMDPTAFAAGLHELLLHDACTGAYAPQPDTCLHEQRVEREVAFGGEAGTVYDVTLRVRGLFEPTTISGGQTPMPQHPYYKVGGTVAAGDWSHWHIEVSDPQQTYWLNHYPSTSHTIYKEDFEATIPIAAGADVTVRVIDGNDREMDNAEQGLPDRRQLIEGVTAEVLDGQVLRLDVIAVEAR